MPSDDVNAVPVIDTSYSMTANGYVDITRRTSKAFVSYFQKGDGLGVVSYDTEGRFTYPTSGVLATVDSNLTQNIEAANAINALSFNGSCTNMGGGIQKARSFLDSAADPKAMVLLSDGYQNCGTPPLGVLPSYPIYSCAMGPHADVHLMQQIATQTGGRYYNAPYPSTMMFIYNEIRSQPTFVQTAQNKISQIQSQGYVMVPAPLGASESTAQFGVVWDDDSLIYTRSANPGPNQISVTLVLPNGQIASDTPAIVGTGYVVYNIPSPTQGTWHAQVISGSGAPTIQVTTGAFEFTGDDAEAANLDVTLGTARAGQPLEVSAKMTEGEKAMTGLRVRAAVTHPAISVEDAIEKHRDELSSFAPDESLLDAEMPEDRARLAALHKHYLPRLDILPHRTYAVQLHEQPDGTYRGAIANTSQAGSYSVHVEARGASARNGATVQRVRHVASVVE